MRLVCPHCMSGVTVADDLAGQEAVCTNCGKSFPTPSRYSAAVVPEAAAAASDVMPAPAPRPVPPAPPTPVTPTVPPGLAPPTPPPTPDGFLPPTTQSAEMPALAGYTKSCGITISPRVVAWLPAVLLTMVLVCTFFPWVGCYAGSSAVYSQRAWGAMFGSTPNRNFRLEEAGTIPGGWLDKVRSDWALLVPFFLFLFLAIIFAWGERGLSSVDPRKVPPLGRLWPWRNEVVVGCAAFAFFLLLAQVLHGFGMERAIRQQVADQFAERRATAASSPAAQAKVEYDQDQAYNAYNVERTWWLYLALLCNALAVLAVVTRVALDNRGNKPPPKILLHY